MRTTSGMPPQQMRMTSRGRECARIVATRLKPERAADARHSQTHTRARCSAEAHTATKRLPSADTLDDSPEGSPRRTHEEVGSNWYGQVTHTNKQVQHQKAHGPRLNRRRHGHGTPRRNAVAQRGHRPPQPTAPHHPYP